MSKLKFASHEEIRQYFINNSTVRWVDVFKNNFVPEKIIFEFKSRIWSGDYGARVQEIINMFVRNKIKISDEMMELLLEKTPINNFYDFEKVYDLPSLLLKKDDSELSSPSMSYVVTSSLYKLKNVTLEYLERVLKLEIPQNEKFDAVRAMLTNGRTVVSDEVKVRAMKFLKESYSSENMKASFYGNGYIEDELFTLKEWVTNVLPKDIISFVDSNYSIYSEPFSDKSIEQYKDPEILDIIVNKILERNETVENPKVPIKQWKWTRKLIKDHPKYKEIENVLMSDEEIIKKKEISWNSVDTQIQDGKLEQHLVDIVLLRPDAPLWFTDKYQSKLLQMMIRKTMDFNTSYVLTNLETNYSNNWDSF